MPHIRMVFAALWVSNLQQSTRFYRDVLGIPLEIGNNDAEGDPWIGGEHREFSWREGAYLHLALFPSGLRGPTANAQLGFFVDDVDALHERAETAGLHVLHAPRDEPWGRTSRYEDPDGNVVGLTELPK